MNKNVQIILLIAMLVAGLFGPQLFDMAKNNVDIIPTPTPVVPVGEPSIEMKEVVKPITNLDIEDEDAARIANFFLEMANVVENDPGFIKSTSIFREFNMTSGGLNFAGTDLNDKYPTLGEAIDAAIVASVGKESVALDAQKRSDLTQCLKAVAWAVTE